MKISIHRFTIIWNSKEKDNETCGYVPNENDLFYLIGNYLFAVETKNGINNIIMKKVFDNCDMSLREVIYSFKDALQNDDVQYIRIEGNTKRYMFLTKMFDTLYKDPEITDRNVFYGKVF